MVTLSQAEGEPTLHERRTRENEQRREQALEHPLVKATLEAFPGASVSVPRDKTGGGSPADDHDTLPDKSEDGE
jgi:hypothetical protein